MAHMVVNIEVDKMADRVANIVVDMEVDKVADMANTLSTPQDQAGPVGPGSVSTSITFQQRCREK